MADKSENNPQNERKIKDTLSKGQKKNTASGKVRKRGERSKNKTVTRKATGKRKSAVSSNTIRTDITDEEAMRILEENCGKAEEILEDPTQREDFLRLVEKKIASVPLVGGAFAYAPLMLSLLKSYISGEYRGISKRSIVLITSAFFYFLYVTDLIADFIPIVGYIDDAAVFAVCMAIVKKELDRYKEWRNKIN